MKIDKVGYKNIYKKAAKQGGWSKGKLDKTIRWGDFYEVARKRLFDGEVVLDIGIAEGNCAVKGIKSNTSRFLLEMSKE